MIRYALACAAGHPFEGWFASSADYDAQEADGRLECPVCATRQISKQIMSPGVVGMRAESPPSAPMMDALGRWRDHVEATYEDVGEGFADEARAIHEGRAEEREIYGQATVGEVADLVTDGVPVAPLPPRPRRKNQLN